MRLFEFEVVEGGSLSSGNHSSTAYLLAIIAGTGLILSIGMLALVKAFTTIILEIALLLSVLFSAAYAAYLWYVGYWSGAIIFTLVRSIGLMLRRQH